MKTAKTKIVANGGETLLESVISVLIFSMLMVVVSTMMMAAIKISANANEIGADMQDTVNKAAQESSGGEEKDITFRFDSSSTKVKVNVFEENGLISFYPTVK